jgi:glycosyltransferase involved in cell wall biosynthesis
VRDRAETGAWRSERRGADPLRIAYVTTAAIPGWRASSYQSIWMSAAFARLGCDVTILHPVLATTGTRPLSEFWAELGISHPDFRLRAIPTIDLAWLRRVRLARAHWLERPLADRIRFELMANSFAAGACSYLAARRGRFDLVFNRSERGLMAPGWLRGWLGVPIVCEVHSISRRAVQLAARADCVVSTTAHMKTKLTEFGIAAARIHVEPNAVDLDRFRSLPPRDALRRELGLPPDRSIAGYIGRFHAMGLDKGIPQLVAAIARLPPSERPLLLCVGGPLDAVPAFHSIMDDEGLPRDSAKFVGHVSNVDVPRWIGACDLVTIPWSRNEFSAYQTSPLKLFEYMAAGVPIVASDLPSLREIIRHGENGWLVEAGSPQALADGIRRLLQHPDLARRLADRAREDVRARSWTERARHILDRLNVSPDSTVRSAVGT